jgi:hypothetical protein
MAEAMHRTHLSQKPILNLELDILDEKTFFFPNHVANDINPFTGESCIVVGVNGRKTYIPIGIKTKISYQVFCVLKDSGLINPERTYESEEAFDLLRGH